MHTWALAPDVNGHTSSTISTVLHPDGRHEVLAVDFTSGSGLWVSEKTGRNYFTEFEVGSSTAKTRLRVRQHSQEGTEARPDSGEGIIVSESYVEGEGIWEGEPVQFFGHMEQLSSRYGH